MGLRTNIERRGAVYRFRARVPVDLITRLGRREIKRSLRTRDPVIARALGAILAADVHRLWSRVRHTVDGDEIKRLMTEWLRRELESDLDTRASWPFDPASKASEHSSVDLLYADAAANLDEWREIVERHRWSDAQPDVERLIEAQRLLVTPGSTVYQRLCMAMAVAQADLHAVRVERSNGNLHAKPQNFDLSSAPLAVAQPAPDVRPATASGNMLKNAVTRYMAERSSAGDLAIKRRHDLLTALDLLMEHLSEQRDVGSIVRQDIGSFRELLTKLPPNRRKRFHDMPLDQVVAKAAERGLPPISPATIHGKYLVPVIAFFGWCESGGLIAVNPAKGMRLAQSKIKARKRRGVYEVEHLRTMFDAPLYRGCQSAARINETGTYKLRNHKFWLPLLAMFTGARLNELCQLRPKDVRQIDETWCIQITEGDESMKVKTEAGERIVPVHEQLIRIGFLDFAATQRQMGHERLFQDLTPGSGGYYSDNATKWFARWLRDTLGAKLVNDVNLTFHGFRHTMKDRLRAASVEEMIQNRLIGHDNGHVSSMYGEGYKPKRLAEELNKVGFEGLDLSHLHQAVAA